MRMVQWICVLALSASSGYAIGADAVPDTIVPNAEPIQLPVPVSVIVRHRVVATFADTLSLVAGSGERMWVGDTEYSIAVVRVVPDFGITQAGDVVERSSVPHNPACQVEIFRDDVAVERVWAFFGTGAPHFRRESILAVDLYSFEWQGKTVTSPVAREAH